MSAVVQWSVILVLFVLSLYLLIAQTRMSRDLSAQPFKTVDGVATTATNVKRVVLAPNKPSDAVLNSLPDGAVYIGATLRFATGHLMEQDPYDNLVLSSVSGGVKTRMATFSPHGAVGFGEMPLTDQQSTGTGLFLTGSPVDTVRDGWQSTGSTKITDSEGNVVGTMANVYHLDDPASTGIQIYNEGAKQAITFTKDGRVVIGTVAPDMLSANTEASLLVGGDVVIDSAARQINFKCLDIERFDDTGEHPMVAVSTLTDTLHGDYLNGFARSFQNTAYFKPGKCYKTTDLPFISVFLSPVTYAAVLLDTESCQQTGNNMVFRAYTEENCTSGTDTAVTSPLNTPTLMQNTGLHYTLRCWRPDETNYPDVQDQYSPS